MPLMEVVLEQSYLEQFTVNRFNYVASGTPAAVSFSFALMSALGAIPVATVYPTNGWLDSIVDCQHVSVECTQVVARDVYSDTDFFEQPFVDPLGGSRSGAAGAPYISLGFRTNRTRLDIRRGSKRFVGVSGDDLIAGGAYDGTFLTGQIIPLAEKLGDVLEYDDEGQTITFTPCIVSREKRQVPGSDPARFAYYYYETEEEQLDHVMTGIIWDPYLTTRSQTTRQYGRGQ